MSCVAWRAQAEWQYKSGGCAGIALLSSKLPPKRARTHQVTFVKALIFVLKVRETTALPLGGSEGLQGGGGEADAA
jgi:hypothetical protein